MVDGNRARYLRGSEADRFWPKVAKGECWEWMAARNEHGYGIFRRSNATNIRAHRWAWVESNGPVPPGLVLDHLCRNRACVNPAHLEVVTQRVNSSRGLPGGRSWRSAITHCPQGHPYDETNTYVAGGSRHCRACKVVRQKRRRQQRRAA